MKNVSIDEAINILKTAIRQDLIQRMISTELTTKPTRQPRKTSADGKTDGGTGERKLGETQLKAIEAVGKGKLTAGEVTEKLGLKYNAGMILNKLVARGLLKKSGDHFHK